jgi:deoxyribodipyrimidine photolyase
MTGTTAIVLLTRDLRTRDNPALAEACRLADRVVPLFVLDRRLLRRSPRRSAFLLRCLHSLEREGFMHNRARMIVASFLTKDLNVDWRHGAAHFDRLLLDGDPANNVGGWQSVAGTGIGSRPGRIFNPTRQAQRFDPDGIYARRHLPSPADGGDHPLPIVDHVEAALAHRHRSRRKPISQAMRTSTR